MPYKYMRICPICQRPNIRHLSIHVTVVHGLNANESNNHLEQAILCTLREIDSSTTATNCKGQTEEDQAGSTGG